MLQDRTWCLLSLFMIDGAMFTFARPYLVLLSLFMICSVKRNAAKPDLVFTESVYDP